MFPILSPPLPPAQPPPLAGAVLVDSLSMEDEKKSLDYVKYPSTLYLDQTGPQGMITRYTNTQ